MSIRMLMASDFYPPFIGGMERQVQLLSRALVRRGHEVHVATTWHEGQPRAEDDEGVIVHRLRGLTTAVPWLSRNPDRRFVPPAPEPGIVDGLRRLLAVVRPDLVHAHGWAAYSAAAAVESDRTPLVVSVRDYGYSCALRTLLRGGELCQGPSPIQCLRCAGGSYGGPKAAVAVAGVLGNRGLLRRVTSAFHCVSSYVRDTIERDLLDGEDPGTRTRVIPSMFVDTPTGPEAWPYLERLPSEPYLLYVGALQAHKGVDVLLAAYERLAGAPPLVLVGSTWAEDQRQYPRGVTVLADLPHGAVMAIWRRCLFGVAPSVWAEPLAATIREGMAAGKAMISTDVGGARDMIDDGESGLLVPSGDVAALAAAMARLIDDPALAARLGAMARRRSIRFTAAAVVPQFEALYAQVLSPAMKDASRVAA